ncbi:3034_t:CDS:2 [Funneliformis caledonium]|uniref:3034_t:CDS:1 n=1 Tax=Funneliformis caledonium TaxID=1117310 RepID=A0A9N8WK02_9GLOM|nr:3034_t:CDS:2 [Funneliformis caledonium]
MTDAHTPISKNSRFFTIIFLTSFHLQMVSLRRKNVVVIIRRNKRFQNLHRRCIRTYNNAEMLRRMRQMGPQNTDNAFATSIFNGTSFA